MGKPHLIALIRLTDIFIEPAQTRRCVYLGNFQYPIFRSSNTAMIHNFTDHFMEIATSSTGDHVYLCLRRPPTSAWRSPFQVPTTTTHARRSPLHRPAILFTFAFGDHRLAHGDRHFKFRRPPRTQGDRHFIDRRSCLPLPSATTD